MPDKFQGKYRIASARLQSWDYGANGAYFITICTKNRKHFFGEIENHQMILNDIGKLAEKYWIEIPSHFPFIELGNFVVMPNHTHGILIIDKLDASVETLHIDDKVLRAASETCRSRFEKTFLQTMASWLADADKRLNAMP